jgi:hypothetical protein
MTLFTRHMRRALMVIGLLTVIGTTASVPHTDNEHYTGMPAIGTWAGPRFDDVIRI